MSNEKIHRGVSKAEWLEKALQTLGKGGVTAITVEGMAKSFGINKSGFYWHFKNRDDLLRQLLNYWSHEVTEVITDNSDLLKLEPKARLIKIADIILDFELTRYEIAIRQWALHDELATKAARRVNRARLDFISSTLSELGFKDDDLDMRAMLFVCYQSLEAPMFPEISRKRRRDLISKRIELLTNKKSN
jgi:AcrR family transcriptional regulator